jgi:hypothetical protein
MRLGIDFDNTIACYDGVFHKAAVERGLIPAGTAADKTSVRDYLRAAGREDDWTELQGYVYGARMDLVACYPGFADFVRRANQSGHDLFVISHKTRHPYRGMQHDLHRAAREFLHARRIVDIGANGIRPENVFFELTLADKIARIAAQRCEVFIDDLPEFLIEKSFPPATRPVLFDPQDHYAGGCWEGRTFETYRTWQALADAILGPEG